MSLEETCIPFSQVSVGSFFRLMQFPSKGRFQKVLAGERELAVNVEMKMVLFRPMVPCFVEANP